jgi:hypothetical protein
MEAIRLTMELNTGEIAIKRTWSTVSIRRVQVVTWMECGEEVLLNFTLPSIASSIYTIYEESGWCSRSS